jgi:hypothetical protein
MHAGRQPAAHHRRRRAPRIGFSLCADEGFEPRIGYISDDMVVGQALVATSATSSAVTALS